MKWGKWKEKMLSILSTVTQYSARTLSLTNKAKERNKRDTDGKGKSQVIPFCRLYDLMLKRVPQKILDLMDTFSKVAGCKTNIQSGGVEWHK
jgi:hypothetical protein